MKQRLKIIAAWVCALGILMNIFFSGRIWQSNVDKDLVALAKRESDAAAKKSSAAEKVIDDAKNFYLLLTLIDHKRNDDEAAFKGISDMESHLIPMPLKDESLNRLLCTIRAEADFWRYESGTLVMLSQRIRLGETPQEVNSELAQWIDRNKRSAVRVIPQVEASK